MNKTHLLIKRFDEVFDLQMGKTPDRKNLCYFEGNNIWVSIRDMLNKEIWDSKEHISDEAITQSGIKKVKAGTVIMSFKLTVGKCAIAQKDLYTNEAIMAFNVRDGYEISPSFLYYYLQSYKWQGTNKAVMGITLNKATISKQIIAIPPLPTQRAIVAELDTPNEILDKKRQQLKELDTLAQSIFYDMFGDPVENEKGWEVKKLGELCTIVRGGSPRPIDKFLGGDVPWIKIGDATKGDDIYLHSTKEHIIHEGIAKSRYIDSGSLIFANCGVSLGFARITTFAGCIHDGWLAFQNILEGEIDKVFLLKSLNMCTQYFRDTAPDGTQPNLNTNLMKNFLQILPPKDLQLYYIKKIKAIEKQKSLLVKSVEEMEMLFNATMDKYFG